MVDFFLYLENFSIFFSLLLVWLGCGFHSLERAKKFFSQNHLYFIKACRARRDESFGGTFGVFSDGRLDAPLTAGSSPSGSWLWFSILWNFFKELFTQPNRPIVKVRLRVSPPRESTELSSSFSLSLWGETRSQERLEQCTLRKKTSKNENFEKILSVQRVIF